MAIMMMTLTEGTVEDEIVVRHLVARGSEFMRILLEAGNLIKGISPPKRDDSGLVIERTVWFNRPDSLDEGIVTRYIEKVGVVGGKLAEISLTLKVSITPFRFPEGVH